MLGTWITYDDHLHQLDTTSFFKVAHSIPQMEVT